MRGVWIDTGGATSVIASSIWSLPVRGAWIEIASVVSNPTPSLPSLPVRGAWIEIGMSRSKSVTFSRRSPCGERGLKLQGAVSDGVASVSLPVRGAWIEIKCLCFPFYHLKTVAPRAGSVD